MSLFKSEVAKAIGEQKYSWRDVSTAASDNGVVRNYQGVCEDYEELGVVVKLPERLGSAVPASCCDVGALAPERDNALDNSAWYIHNNRLTGEPPRATGYAEKMNCPVTTGLYHRLTYATT